jgi:DNA polymerase-4
MTASADNPLILHVDVDAFFASVEQLLIPALRRRPVIVGSGVIASCSYEARRFGLHAGMPLGRARKLCPQAVVLAGDQSIYRCFAEHVWEVCRHYTVELETFLDEAYGDAAGMERIHGEPLSLGRKLQRHVLDQVGLPVSVGLASNRMLAKLASGSAKPGGVAHVPDDRAGEFLAPLPIEKLPGVGRKTARMLADLNVATIGALRELPRALLAELLGRRGEVLFDRARGQDPRPLRPAGLPRTISRETTFHQPTGDRAQVEGMLHYLLQRATRTARQSRLIAAGVELSIRYDDWKQLTARRTLPEPTDSDEVLRPVIEEMLDRLHRRRVALRHVGVVLTGLGYAGNRPRLFETPPARQDRRLHRVLDDIRDRYGHAAVVNGKSVALMGQLNQNDYGFILRTPSLTK